MKKLLFFALALVVLTRCAPNNQKLVLEVLKTDRDFSQMSIDKGRNQAFIYYAADSVVMPREGNFPILGKQALVKHLATSIDKSFKLRWTPLRAEAAGDLAYTFGNWELQMEGKDSLEYGNYVTVWKKMPSGEWRYILDAGNNTPKPQ
jgi:ketosteroid isomerase-like protein